MFHRFVPYCTPDQLDRAMISSPGVIGYHRYMDDGIVACSSKDAVIQALRTLECEAGKLSLALNRNKTHINRIIHPFVFCKMRFVKRRNGTVKVNIRKQQTHRSVRHARKVAKLAESKPWLDIDLAPVRASLSGYVCRGDADLTRLTCRVFDQG